MRRWLLVLALVLAAARAVLAEPVATFVVDFCAWKATHVVVVGGAERSDAVRVLESWVGDLKTGDRLTIAGLVSVAPPGTRRSRGAEVSRERAVVYLVRADDGSWAAAYPGPILKASVAFVETGTAFVFRPHDFDGPLVLSAWGTEESLRARTRYVAGLRSRLAGLEENEPRVAKRAEAIAPLTSSDCWLARGEAFLALGRCQDGAVPVLRGLLADPARLSDRGRVVRAYAATGAPEFEADVSALLETELAFWKRVGPGLDAGWWGDDHADEARCHYGMAHETLIALHEHPSSSCRDAVTAFRDYWSSIPALDEVGSHQIAGACRDALDVMSR